MKVAVRDARNAVFIDGLGAIAMLRKIITNRPGVSVQARFCSNCGKELGRLERLMSNERGRCKDCDRSVRAKLKVWRDEFRNACQDGLLSPAEWGDLRDRLPAQGISVDEGVEHIQRDALNFVERSFAFSKADGHLDEAEEATIRWLMQEMKLTNAAPHIVEEMAYLANLRRIGQGNIPTIRPSVVIPPEELCYFDGTASYHKVSRGSITPVPGRLIATSRRVIFVAPSGGGEIPLGKVLNVNRHPNGVFLELSRKANSGFYAVSDPRLVTEIILAAVRLATRQLLASGDRDTRSIPHHLKVGVWQRDQGRCTQCSATEYLEFDHVIPYSKGGATSLNNLQLLCRKCNLQKGDSL